MDFWTILGCIAIGVVFYYILFQAPSSNIVFSSPSNVEVKKIKQHLEANGITTYIKSKDMRPFHRPGTEDLVAPSLHVVKSNERKKAIRLIRDFMNK